MEEELNNQGEKYEYVNHPSHYNRYPIEAVEMARRIWGDEAMKTAAEITAFFYRMRLGLKPSVSVAEDIEKENFWLNYAKKIEQVIKDAYAYQHPCAAPDERTILND